MLPKSNSYDIVVELKKIKIKIKKPLSRIYMKTLFVLSMH